MSIKLGGAYGLACEIAEALEGLDEVQVPRVDRDDDDYLSASLVVEIRSTQYRVIVLDVTGELR